jgi:hypothetical protein
MIVSGFEAPEVADVQLALEQAGGKICSAHARGSWSALVVSV